MKRISFETTGLPSPAQAGSNSTGLQLGAVGSAEQEKARARLVGRKPKEVDRSIQASPMWPQGVELSEKQEWRFPLDKPAYQVSTSAGLTGLSKENQAEVIRILRLALTPVSYEQAEKLASQLSTLPRRNMSVASAEEAFDLYVRRLLDHPADVACEVVRSLVEEPAPIGEKTWLPSPPELEAMLRNLSSFRKAALEAALYWTEPPARDEEAERLHEAWAIAEHEVKRANDKVGPGPITDTGPRGDRIAHWEAKKVEAAQARETYFAHLEAKRPNPQPQ